jgi:hypothetical protein
MLIEAVGPAFIRCPIAAVPSRPECQIRGFAWTGATFLASSLSAKSPAHMCDLYQRSRFVVISLLRSDTDTDTDNGTTAAWRRVRCGKR